MSLQTQNADLPTMVVSSVSETQSISPKKGGGLWPWAKKNGYRNLFFSNASGNVGVLISGIFEGNAGRIITPALNIARNLGAGGIIDHFNKKGSKKAALIATGAFMALPILTNLPLLFTAATTAELLAVSVLVTGYTVKTMSKLIQAHRSSKAEKAAKGLPEAPSKVLSSISQRVGIDIEKGKRARSMYDNIQKISSGGLSVVERGGDLMPAVLLFRGSMRVLDGVMRLDPFAIGAGVCFVAGAGCMALGDHNDRQELKTQLEKSKAKPPSVGKN